MITTTASLASRAPSRSPLALSLALVALGLFGCTSGEVGRHDGGPNGEDSSTGPRACSTTVACPTGQSCEGGTCAAKSCSTASDCPSGQPCTAGRCAPTACASHGGCPSGEACSDGYCSTIQCAGESQCPSGAACEAGFCTAGEGTTTPCERNDECASGTCSSGRCVPVGEACGEGESCSGGLVCVAGRCAPETCTAPSECPAGLACEAGSCAQIDCATPSECPYDHSCTRGSCTAPGERTAGPDHRRDQPYAAVGPGGIIGLVVNLQEVPIEGVRVSVDAAGISTMTREDGTYELREVPAGEHVVHFDKAGLIGADRATGLGSWETVIVNERLMESNPPVTIDSGTTNTVGDPADATATIPGGVFVDSAGVPVDGPVTVSVTGVDPTTGEIDGAPGDFTATTDEGEVALDSEGMVQIITVDEDGNPVQPDENTSIEITIPVPPRDIDEPPAMVGDCIDTWIWNETTGVWDPTGEVACIELREGRLVYVGRTNQTNIVWNCDDPVVPVCYRGTVRDCAGQPVAGAEVSMRGSGVNSASTARTDADGRYEISGTARTGAILRAAIRMGPTEHIDESPVLRVPSGGACGSAPDLSFEIVRYTTGRIEFSRLETRSWDGTEDVVDRRSSGSASFVDVADPNAGASAVCPQPADDTVREGGTTITPLGEQPYNQDVGSPIVIEGADQNVDVVRNFSIRNGLLRVSPYVSVPSATPVNGETLTVDIPGAELVLPHTRIVDAIHMPDALVLTSPALGAERVVNASAGLPIRWTPSSTSTDLTLTMYSAGSPPQVVLVRLTDDGSYDVPASELSRFAGRTVRLSLTRSRERFEPLPTGPALQLIGATTIDVDVTVN